MASSITLGRRIRRRRSAGTLVVVVFLVVMWVGCAPETDNAVEETSEIIPGSSLTSDELREMVEFLPKNIQQLIETDPAGFLDLVYEVLDESEELLWIVDKEHALRSDYEPPDLIDLDGYSDRLSLSQPDHHVRQIIIPDLFAMVDAAREASVNLQISSAYRSYAYQKGVYERWVAELGQEEADRTSARPGRSQHQLGTTIDFGCICDEFADTDAGRWIADNARRYGFSMSYPPGLEELTGYAYESWHFRYIGRTAARLEHEFFSGVQHYMLKFLQARR